MPAQSIRQNRLHKFLHKKLGIPRNIVQPFLSTFKVLGSPHQFRLRKQLAKDIMAEGKRRLFIPEEDGYRIFAPDDFQEIGPIVRYCEKCTRNHGRLFQRNIFKNTLQKNSYFLFLKGWNFFAIRLYFSLWFLVFFWMRRLPILERFPGWLEQDCAGLLKMQQICPVSSIILTMKI